MEEFRKQIDQCDKELIAILKKRMAVSRKIGIYKKENGLQICDPIREKAVLERLKTFAGNDLMPDVIEKIYTEIFLASKSLQR